MILLVMRKFKAYCHTSFFQNTGEKMVSYGKYYICEEIESGNFKGIIRIHSNGKIYTIDNPTFKYYFYTIEELRDKKINDILFNI